MASWLQVVRTRLSELGNVTVEFGPSELIAVVTLGTILRLYRIADESLWLDEAYSVGIVRRHTIGWLAFDHPTFDPHPPLHYLLLKPWVAFVGPSEMAVRLQAALFGIGTIVVTYWLGRDLFDRRVGTIGALLVAVAPFHVWQSQNIRMYTLLAFLTGLSYLFLVRLTREVTVRRVVSYVVATVLLGFTHVFGLFVVIAQGMYLITRPILPGERFAVDRRRWIPLQGAVLVLLSPWLFELASRAMTSTSSPSTHVSWIPDPGPSVFLETFLLFVSGKHLDWHLDPAIPGGVPLVLGVVSAACIAVSLARVETGGPWNGAEPENGTDVGSDDATGLVLSFERTALAPVWLLGLLAVVPVAVPFVLSKAISPILIPRYTIPASLGVYLLIARGASGIRLPPVRYLLVGMLVIGMLVPLPAYYGGDQKEQWREAASFVEAGTDGDDLVVLSPAHVWWPFDYYFDGAATVETADDSTTPAEIREMARGHDRVYLVFRYPGPETREQLRGALEEGPQRRSPTERSFVVVTVVEYGNETAT